MYQAPEINEQEMYQQQQPMQQQQPQMSQEDSVAQAKAMMGIDQIEAQMMAHTKILEEASQKAIQSEMKARYPNVNEDAVNKEIERIRGQDGALADSMMKSSAGLETVYKAIMSASKPMDTPDDLLDSSGTMSQGSLETKIKSGKASNVELGDYILGGR